METPNGEDLEIRYVHSKNIRTEVQKNESGGPRRPEAQLPSAIGPSVRLRQGGLLKPSCLERLSHQIIKLATQSSFR